MTDQTEEQAKTKRSLKEELQVAAASAEFGMSVISTAQAAWNASNGTTNQPNVALDPGKVCNDSMGLLRSSQEVFSRVASGTNPIGAAKEVAANAQKISDGLAGVLGPAGAVVSVGMAISKISEASKIGDKAKPSYLLKELKKLDQQIEKQGGIDKAKPELVEKRRNLSKNAVALAKTNIEKVLNNSSLSPAQKQAKIDALAKEFSLHNVFPGKNLEQIKAELTTPPTPGERAAANAIKENVKKEKNQAIISSVSSTLNAVGTVLVAASPAFPPLAVAGTACKAVSKGVDLAQKTQAKPKKTEEVATKPLDNDAKPTKTATASTPSAPASSQSQADADLEKAIAKHKQKNGPILAESSDGHMELQSSYASPSPQGVQKRVAVNEDEKPHSQQRSGQGVNSSHTTIYGSHNIITYAPPQWAQDAVMASQERRHEVNRQQSLTFPR